MHIVICWVHQESDWLHTNHHNTDRNQAHSELYVSFLLKWQHESHLKKVPRFVFLAEVLLGIRIFWAPFSLGEWLFDIIKRQGAVKAVDEDLQTSHSDTLRCQKTRIPNKILSINQYQHPFIWTPCRMN